MKIFDLSNIKKYDGTPDPNQFWMYNLFISACSDYKEIYYYYTQGTWVCCSGFQGEYLPLIQPVPEFTDGLSEHLTGVLFQKNELSDYFQNDCDGHMIILINCQIANLFIWQNYNGFSCYYIRIFSDLEFKEAALRVWNALEP